ncbi:MAG TPA: hypothetical protein VGO57_15200 [Verrucomicrobiae bacterium]|jgi:hypothetical protein
MKNIIALAVLGGTLAASPIMAANYDLYLTGSTAFRANVFAACQALYDSSPASNNGTTTAGASDALWTMTGTCVTSGLTSGSDTLTIHANWTGSVQGLSALLNKDQLGFLLSASSGSALLVTNTASAAFSDVYSGPTLDPLPSSSFTEKEVAVQPFIFVKSVAPGGVQSITNVSWQQLNSMLGSFSGSVPLSYFTSKSSDAGQPIYLVHRTLDSGTRVTTVQEAGFVGTVKIYYYDPIGGTYYYNPTNRGPEAFGAGYVGGGDVKAVMASGLAGNQAIAYLSMADAKGITGVNWQNMLAYNGNYPILNYTPGVAPVTNDYSPIMYGKYSFWAFECLDWPKTGQWQTYSDQNLSFAQLTAAMNKLTGTGAGSIDYTVLTSQASGATAVRLSDMHVGRQTVGGPIAP